MQRDRCQLLIQSKCSIKHNVNVFFSRFNTEVTDRKYIYSITAQSFSVSMVEVEKRNVFLRW